MRSRIAVRGVLLVLALLVATPLAAEAQPKDSQPRVGHLFVIPSSATAHLREAFRQGLRELGYVEGQNLIIEFRSADGRAERLPELATELVRLRVDVIVAAPDVSIRAAQLATRTIPIVMAVSLDDPVEQRFVASLARPGDFELRGPSYRTRHVKLDLHHDLRPPSAAPTRIPGNHRPEFPEPTAVEAAGIRHRYIRPRRLQHNGKMPVLSITDPDRGTEGQS